MPASIKTAREEQQKSLTTPSRNYRPQPVYMAGRNMGIRAPAAGSAPFQQVLMIDNFDSFTYNLVHDLRAGGINCTVRRNNDEAITDPAVLSRFDLIVISPGPETPADAGYLMECINKIPENIPVLGICLGMQALGMADGAVLQKAPVPMHGKVSDLNCSMHHVFKGLPEKLGVMRYHSLILNFENALNWDIIASTNDGVPMMCVHRLKPWMGIQFHPESVLTECGPALLQNCMEYLELRTDD